MGCIIENKNQNTRSLPHISNNNHTLDSNIVSTI